MNTHNGSPTLRVCKDCGKPIRATAFAQRKPENKLILLCQKCRLRKLTGDKNPNWKGTEACLRAIYRRKENQKKAKQA